MVSLARSWHPGVRGGNRGRIHQPCFGEGQQRSLQCNSSTGVLKTDASRQPITMGVHTRLPASHSATRAATSASSSDDVLFLDESHCFDGRRRGASVGRAGLRRRLSLGVLAAPVWRRSVWVVAARQRMAITREYRDVCHHRALVGPPLSNCSPFPSTGSKRSRRRPSNFCARSISRSASRAQAPSVVG